MDQLRFEPNKRPVIICLSKASLALAQRLAGSLGADIHGHALRCPGAPHHFGKARTHIAEMFASGRPVIGICSAGILIRAVAPYIRHKSSDAPVLSVSENGAHVVPLIGGHHGALVLGRKVADALDASLAITTAGDLRWQASLDEPPIGWRLANPGAAARVMAQLLAGDGAYLDGEGLDDLSGWFEQIPRGSAVTLTTTRKQLVPSESQLVYCPQDIVVGAGCARGCAPDELIDLVMRELARANINAASVAMVASVDLKADEPALHALASMLAVPLRVFERDDLAAETPRLKNPSQVVFDEIGIYGVAEAAALAAAGPKGKLIHQKAKSDNATVALSQAPTVPMTHLRGRKPGRVMLVGIGPGQAEWRTPEASRMVLSADELVGYGLYIDILGAVAAHIPRRDFELGEEEARCRYALEQAATGKDIAIICSGDAGIYAMGALVYELLDRPEADGGVSDAARRVSVVTAPGISALQAAAARSGAILGHDFCTISLSDLLTPWQQIENRIHAAGAGDFVVAFYNPVSQRRRVQLATARDILIQYRGGDVPVLLASNLGRPEEKLIFRTLATLDVDEVDMLTTVMVGASSSRQINLGRGQAIYTPRGYAKHLDKASPNPDDPNPDDPNPDDPNPDDPNPLSADPESQDLETDK
ncbi:precorrin-3B C(17)-methyltransferase [Alphaproteobacteria bacterium]|nr:precorrin-3B C(17)-methyltransferase [Alphaproteobacteria bacterium]